MSTKDTLPRHHGSHMQGEDLDATPLEMPLGSMTPTPINEIIARLVQNAIAKEKDEAFESFEEAEDFSVDDEGLLDMSPYTLNEIEPDESGYEVEEAPEAPEEPETPPPQELPAEDKESRPADSD